MFVSQRVNALKKAVNAQALVREVCGGDTPSHAVEEAPGEAEGQIIVQDLDEPGNI